jgi:hypothetical protein
MRRAYAVLALLAALFGGVPWPPEEAPRPTATELPCCTFCLTIPCPW